MKKSLALAVVPLVLLLSACGGGVKKDATYEDASSLRQAVIKSGVECPGETVADNDDGGSIKCSSDLLLEIINDETTRQMSPVVFSLTKSKQSLLIGPNWVIQGETGSLDSIKAKLGGQLTVP